MKTFIITIICLAFTTMAFAANYKALTKDSEVTTKAMVQVEQTKAISQKTTYTLSYINTHISVLTTKVANLQAELAEMQALKTAVDNVAKTVKLKVKAVEPVE